MRVSTAQQLSTASANHNTTDISTSSMLRITLTLSAPLTIQHKPIILPNGMISTSPPYLHPLSTVPQQPEFIPYRPTFETPPTIGKDTRRHAALIAHLNAELREGRRSFENVARECRRGRGGYQGPR